MWRSDRLGEGIPSGADAKAACYPRPASDSLLDLLKTFNLFPSTISMYAESIKCHRQRLVSLWTPSPPRGPRRTMFTRIRQSHLACQAAYA